MFRSTSVIPAASLVYKVNFGTYNSIADSGFFYIISNDSLFYHFMDGCSQIFTTSDGINMINVNGSDHFKFFVMFLFWLVKMTFPKNVNWNYIWQQIIMYQNFCLHWFLYSIYWSIHYACPPLWVCLHSFSPPSAAFAPTDCFLKKAVTPRSRIASSWKSPHSLQKLLART